MAFPSSTTATPTTFAAAVTSMPVNLPASIASGDLLIAHVGVRNAGTWTPPAGWTVLVEQAGGGAVGETGVWYRIADGSEGATATWTAGTATTGAWQVRKITSWHGTTPPEYTSTNGDSVSVNPPSLTPSWGAADTLFLALAGSSADTMTFSGAPTNYSDLVSTTASSGGGAANAGSAIRQLNAVSDDPGTFTTSTNRWWAAFTIAVRPVVSGGSVAATNLATTGSSTDATSYNTASVTPTSNNLVLLWVYSICTTAPNTPTASGNGLTWVAVGSTTDGAGSPVRRLTLFRAMGASPSAGVITIDFAGQTQTGCAWSVVEYSGINTGGTNGSSAIVQSATNNSAGATATSLTVTLAAFASANNATAGGFGIPLNTAGLPAAGSGFTATGQRNQATPNLAIGSEFNSGNDTSVDMTSAASSIPWAGIAVEIAQASTPASSGNMLMMFGA